VNNARLFTFFIVVVLLLISLTAVSFGIENSVVGEDSSLTSDLLEYNIQKRKMLGLNSDLSYVKNLLINESTRKANKQDIYLTEEEGKYLEKRFNELDEKVPKIINYLVTNLEDEYGGLYVKQDEGGVLYICIKDFSDKHLQVVKDINDIFGNPENVRFIKVKYSEVELNKVHNRIFENIKTHELQGIRILSIATDTLENEVEVGIIGDTETSRNLLKRTYGDMLNIFESTEDMITNDAKSNVINPVQGGIKIKNTTNGSTCSAGFSAVKVGGYYYIVTAGHCADGGYYTFAQPSDLTSGYYYIGASNLRRYSGDVDALLIQTSSSITSNKVYFFNQGDELLTSFQPESNEYVGQYVAVSGQFSTSWGLVGSINVSKGVLTNLTAANYTAIPGDSGGTIFNDYNGQLFGIHQGNATVNGQAAEVYTQVENILDHFGIGAITW
jgi:hypothetical protein